LESVKQLNPSAIPPNLTHATLILACSGVKVGVKPIQAKVKRVKRGRLQGEVVHLEECFDGMVIQMEREVIGLR